MPESQNNSQILILFENMHLVAADKPTGLASIPESDPQQPSLRAMLEAQFGADLFAVHRLDKDASGVIVFAKHADAHRHLSGLFRERQVKKTYLVLVHGVLQSRQGSINKPIRQFGSGRMGVDARKGKPSLTDFEVLRTFDQYTYLKAYPLTGRRHQIRVHLYSLGHPIVGDLRYGDSQQQQGYPRLMLHAHQIDFQDPSGQNLSIVSPNPQTFEDFIQDL